MKCYAIHNIYGCPLPQGGCCDDTDSGWSSWHVAESTKECEMGYDPAKCRHHVAQYDEFTAWVNEVRAIKASIK